MQRWPNIRYKGYYFGINMKELKTIIKNLELNSPLLTASGTSGHSGEDLNSLKISENIKIALGAFVTKGITYNKSDGNREFRIVETCTGLLNSIGLQNKGVKFFVDEELPGFLNFELPIIVNISGSTVDEYTEVASYLSENDTCEIIKGIEINVSCPNLEKGGDAFGTDPEEIYKIVKSVKRNIDSRILVITKLTPNITDITLPARAAIEAGTDALAMINTLRGMAIDIETHEPILGNKTGGLSGPAIKPVGVFMVYECFRKIPECYNQRIPIIGIGGISNYRDTLEYIMAGATAVGIGTAWFVNVNIFSQIYADLKTYLKNNNAVISELIGITHKSKKIDTI
jgi:dihydroorotate dehydrogenase (NAD+) catalytic subunit